MTKIKGLLIDLNGTLYFKGEAVDGAVEAVGKLRQDYAVRFLTNTDSKSTGQVNERLEKFGFSVQRDELHTRVVASVHLLANQNSKTVFPLVSDSIEEAYEPFKADDRPTDYVLVGDFRDKVSYSLMNEAFQHIDAGADILALQEAPYSYTKEGKNLDTGSFVRLFEYASGKTSRVLCKPSEEFFLSVIERMDLTPEEVAIVGDDLNTDISGACSIGAMSFLVKTGKYQDHEPDDNAADYVIESITQLPRMLRFI